MEILVCGGDIRQLYMAESLCEKGYDISFTLFEKSDVKNIQNSKKAIRSCDAVILPLPVSRGGKYINTPFSDSSLPVNGISSLLDDAQIVFGGMMPFSLCEELREKNIKYFDYYKNEKLILRNAVPTAEGVLGILINNIPITVASSRCLITGYGRCGKAISELLLKNGAKVTVAARGSDALSDAAKNGCGTIPIGNLSGTVLNYDAVINTVPHRILTKSVLEKIPKSCVLIEIASAPFGIDFDYADELGLKVIKAASLPGKVSPKTAGIIIADSIADYLTGRGDL